MAGALYPSKPADGILPGPAKPRNASRGLGLGWMLLRIFGGGLLQVADLLGERVAVDAEAGGGFGEHIVTEGQHLGEQLALHAADQTFEKIAVLCRNGLEGSADDLTDLRVQIAGRPAGDRHAPLRTRNHQLEVDPRLAIGEHHRALDVVLQLANVARPWIALQA